jgi:HlyD family secretion protein
MNKRLIMIIAAPVLVAIIVIIFIAMPKNTDYKKDLQFVTIEKGTVKSLVSCTGTIEAKGTVDVGTQVSGTVASVNADYNDNVKKDQILATLDPTLLNIAVDQAEADLNQATVQYEHALKQYNDNVALHNDKLISDFDFETVKVSKDSAYSSKLTAEASLKKAKANLSNSIVKSPINGTVIDRNVEVGQTVAASLSSPTLFVIAENLSNMEIDALVDENDIGNINLNQNVSFTVESYPDLTFSGKVTQIRLKPTTVSNVVNYTVIIDAPNPKRILLPGMTANVDIITNQKDDVFLVTNNALKFKPTQTMTAELKKNMKPNGDATRDMNVKNGGFTQSSDNSSNGFQNRQKSDRQGNGNHQYGQTDGGNTSNPQNVARNKAKANVAQLYYLDKDNNLKVMFVRTGLSDSQKTEITGENLVEGMKIISSATAVTKQNTSTTNSQNRGQNFSPRLF